MVSFDQLWEEALVAFYNTTDKRLDDKLLPTPTTLEDLKLEIVKKQESFSEFRKKRDKIFHGLSKALRPIELLGTIAAGGISNAFPPSGIIFNAVTYLFNTASGVSASYDSIVALLEELARFTTRFTIHAKQEVTPELRGIYIEILICIIRICGYTGSLIKHGRVGEYFKKLYLGNDNEIAKEFVTLNRLTDTEARLVGALTLSTATETSKQVNSAVVVLSEVNLGVQSVNLGITDLRDQVSSLVMKMNDLQVQDRNDIEKKQLEKIRLALSPSVTPEEIYRAISGKRVPGTGDWVHSEARFKSWLERDHPVLWISGGPGAGKSYLSSNIIDFLTKLYPQRVQASSRISIAYYFCKHYDSDLRSFNKALRTLAYQVCQNDLVFAKYVAAICSFPEDIRTTESLWRKLFVEFFGTGDQQSSLYILIDGMDEAVEEERTTFLELLKSLQEKADSKARMRVQILLVGRPELSYDIQQVLDENLPTISVSAQKNSADIQSYVTTKVSKERNFRRISKTLRDDIINELTGRADGMFLWVDLMLKEVASKHKETQMRQALHEAPKGLSDTIQRTLDRMQEELSEEDAADLMTLLSWVTCAKRPFRLGELEDILKLTSVDGEGVVYLEGSLRKRYASFFNVNREDERTTEDLELEHQVVIQEDEENSLADAETILKTINHDAGVAEDFGENMDIDSDPKTTEITLSHASFGDFFRIHKSTDASITDYSAWSLQITKHLLRVLCDDDVLRQWSGNTLTGYAAHYWQSHLRDVKFESTSDEDRSEIGKSLVKMFRDKTLTLTWPYHAIASNQFLQYWIYTDEFCDLVKRWLASASLNLTEDDSKWNETMQLHGSADLFNQVYLSLEESWLKSWDSYAEVMFIGLKFYQDKKNARERHASLPKPAECEVDLERLDLANITSARILEISRGPGYDESFIWNCRVARVLKAAGHADDAIHYYQKSVNIAGPGDQLWHPWIGIGHTLSQQNKLKEAITAIERGLQAAKNDPAVPESVESDIRNYWTTELLSWHRDLNNLDAVEAISAEILENFPDQYVSATRYVDMLLRSKKYEAAMEVYRTASKEMLEDKGFTRLTDWCIESSLRLRESCLLFVDTLAHTCRVNGDKVFAKRTYLDALSSIKKTDSLTLCILQLDYGFLLWRELGKTKQATRLFEKLMEELKPTKLNRKFFAGRALVGSYLCKIYLQQAMAAGKDSPEAGKCIEKLAGMWKLSVMWQEQEELTTLSGPVGWNTLITDGLETTSDAAICLGTLYQAFGEPEKARSYLRSCMKLGLDFLSDDDPENDWQGYMKIGNVLLRTGDDSDTISAFAMISPKWIVEDPVASSAPDSAEEPDGEIPWIGSPEDPEFSCDGCGQDSTHGVQGMYCCRYCIDICFDVDCYQLLMTDKLPIHICGKDHKFFYMPEYKPFKKGLVPVDGKEVEEKEWLAKIRAEWEL